MSNQMRKGATIDGQYRYDLWRYWHKPATESLRICRWVMLNPSTADEFNDDSTIRRCIAYAKRWGFNGIEVTNLFAFRATDPNRLLQADDPVGPHNDEYLTDLQDVETIIFAWGTGKFPLLANRAQQVIQLLKDHNPMCLRLSKDGQPVHPLYQLADIDPVPFFKEA